MNISITKMVSFDAAHSLPDHEGKCRNLHGHHYTVEVTVAGPLQNAGPARAMVMDFGDLEGQVETLIVEPLDHQYLNDVLSVVPTAESVATWMYTTLQEAGLPVTRLRLYETPTSYAEVSG